MATTTETPKVPVPEIDMRLFAQSLKVRRAMEKLSIQDVADRTGVSQATISRAENGRPIDLALFVALVRWLGLSADELLGLQPRISGVLPSIPS